MPAQAGQRKRTPLTPNVQALGARQAAELLGYSLKRFYELTQEPDFPVPVQLTPGGDKKWIRDELMEWVRTRPRVQPRAEDAS